jgi:ABC-type Na+ transport system ATPase subunit NatA
METSVITRTAAPPAVDAPPPAVRVRGLRRAYGHGASAYEAVRGVDLDVPTGSITALLGTNGAGKTSTLEVLEGLAPATAGQISVLGLDPVADRAAIRRRTGVLLQRSGFSGDLTVRETLQLWGDTLTRPRPVDDMLALLSLERRADVRMLALSGGETRRVDLACTLMGSPELAILDEPTTGLDPESRREVWRLVSDLRAGGATVLITRTTSRRPRPSPTGWRSCTPAGSSGPARPTEIAAGHPSTISFADTPGVPEDLFGVRRVVREYGRVTLETDALQRSLADLLTGRRCTTSSSTTCTPAAPAWRPCSCPSPTAMTRPTTELAWSKASASLKEPSDDRHDHPSAATTWPAGGHEQRDRFSVRRTASLTRWNAILLSRNRLAFFYASLLPLLPLLLLLTGERGSVTAGAGAINTMFLTISLFTVYYNVLAQFVSRRDELVLKRMRTGQTRDAELLTSIALPGVAAGLVLSALAIPLAAAFGQPLPVNPLLYATMAVLAAGMFTAFAYCTAAWTRNAEAAQLTSMPIILLASFGSLTRSIPGLPDLLRDLISLTPGTALTDLIRIGWFGLDGPDATTSTLTFAETWGPAAAPLLAILAWTYLAVALTRRSLQWEPRT